MNSIPAWLPNNHGSDADVTKQLQKSPTNKPFSQIPQCTTIEQKWSHFCSIVVYCGIWDSHTVGLVRLIHCMSHPPHKFLPVFISCYVYNDVIMISWLWCHQIVSPATNRRQQISKTIILRKFNDTIFSIWLLIQTYTIISQWSFCVCTRSMRDDVMSSLIVWVHTQNDPCIVLLPSFSFNIHYIHPAVWPHE